MKVELVGIPSKNKTVDARVIECSERSERLEDAKTRLDCVGEWIAAKDKWGLDGDRRSSKGDGSVKRAAAPRQTGYLQERLK
jgi:hypothetical protein